MRVNERDLPAEEAGPRPPVDELRPAGRQPLELRGDVVDREREVVHARAASGDEPSDRGVRAERREQLDPALAEAEERHLDAVLLEHLAVLEHRAEEPAVGGDGAVEVVDRDPNVVDARRAHAADASGRPA